jgi:serine/threonine protein kinase
MLDYIITHGRLSDKETRVYSRQIASALDYCHKNHIVHRNVKIESMLLTRTRDIKLIDFVLSSPFSQRATLIRSAAAPISLLLSYYKDSPISGLRSTSIVLV